MDKTREMLTVYFEEPFWVGIFERISGGMLTVCKVTFGAEPKDYEVQEFILKHYSKLRFSPAVEIKVRSAADHPKRRMRNAKKQLEHSGVGTKSQQALQRQREESKTERRRCGKRQKEAEEQRKFDLKQQKRISMEKKTGYLRLKGCIFGR